jgi:hypothetical protein
LQESTLCSFDSGPIIDILPNPSQERASQLAYIARLFKDSPFGDLFVLDISTQKAEFLDLSNQHTCMTFSNDGDILMAGTKYGELMYYDLINREHVPTRRSVPTELPKLQGNSWWSNYPLRSF